MNYFNLKNKKGFTLVETLVGIAIFTASVVAMLSVLGNGLLNTSYARDKIVANYLTQESLEYFRNVRDNKMIFSPLGFGDFSLSLANCFDKDCGFVVPLNSSINEVEFFACDDDPYRCELGVEAGKYTDLYSGGSVDNKPSGFRRVFRAKQKNPDQIEITSTVYWDQPSGRQQISISEILFNWY